MNAPPPAAEAPTPTPDPALFAPLSATIAGGHAPGEKLLSLPQGMPFRRLAEYSGEHERIEIINGQTPEGGPTFDKVWVASTLLDQPAQAAPAPAADAAPAAAAADAVISVPASEYDLLLTLPRTMAGSASYVGNEVVLETGRRYRLMGEEKDGKTRIAVLWGSNPDGSLILRPMWVSSLMLALP